MLKRKKILIIISDKRRGFWRKKKDAWYCADSTDRAGYTEVDPSSSGYYVDGVSAVCPEVSS